MRVHPTVVRSSVQNWQYPTVITLLVIAIISSFMRGDGTPDKVLASTTMPTRNVLVVIDSLTAGARLLEDSVTVEARPLNTLSSDVVTDFEDIYGKVAAGPIPAGYPLARTLLVDADEYQDSGRIVNEIDEAEETLKVIRNSTVALGIQFSNFAPKRGSRIAISVSSLQAKSAIVADEAWVEDSNGNFANVRVPSHVALFLQEVRGLGKLSYFELAKTGPSPFSKRVVSDINDLRKLLGISKNSKPTSTSGRNTYKGRKPGSFSSYAWVTGQGTKYSIDDEGKIYVINPGGNVSPLYEFLMKDYSLSGSQNDSRRQADGDNRRVQTGLEPLYPFMGIEVGD